jgi:hypothetical protein
VNPDISESAVAVAGQAELSTVTDGTEASVLTGSDDMTAAIRRGRVGRELWPILLIAGLVVLLIEAAVARRLTRRSTDI